MKKLLALAFILLAYSGYAQNKLYKHNSVVITATRMTYPGGVTPFVTDTIGKPDYTDFISIDNSDLYGGYTLLTTRQRKDGIDSLVTVKTFTACTDSEKDVASKWFVVDKSDRDTRHTASQQEVNAELLIRNIFPELSENNIIFCKNTIKDADKIAVDNLISDGISIKEISFDSEQIFNNASVATFLGSTSTKYNSFSGTGPIDDAGIGMIVPADYESGGEFYMWWTMDGTGAVSDTARIVLNLTQGNKDSTDVHSQVDETIEFKNQTYSGTTWRIMKSASITIGLILRGGEYLHVEIERDPSHSSDNSGDTFYMQQLVFKYASQ